MCLLLPIRRCNMRKLEVLTEQNITCDLIEKCLMKVQKRYPAVRIQKFGDARIMYYESTGMERKIGSLSRNKEGKLELEIH